MTLAVCSYNLHNGGLDGGDPARLDRQLRMLAQLDLDVLAIQEAKSWDCDHFRLLHRAEHALGMRGFLVPFLCTKSRRWSGVTGWSAARPGCPAQVAGRCVLSAITECQPLVFVVGSFGAFAVGAEGFGLHGREGRR